MKIKTVLVAGLAGGIGYVLGTKAGTSRYDEIRAKADQLAKSPQVQETVANIAEGVKKNAAKLPDPVADVVTAVADKATGGSSASSSSSSSSSGSGTSTGAAAGAGAGLGSEAGLSTESSFDTTPSTAADLDLDVAETSDLSDTTGFDSTSTLGDSTTSLDEPTDPFVEPSSTTDPFDSTDQPRNL
jgi:hypothetical protein